MRLYIGIDNGLNGGIVMLDKNQNILYKYIMPTIKIGGKSEYDVQNIIRILNVLEPAEAFVCLEKSHVRPVSGKRACFMNGFGYGLMQGIIESIGMSYEIVKPQVWMKELEIDSKDTKGSIPFCQRKWPKENWTATEKSKKPHDGLTDAACLALYNFRRNKK
jgi:hypothetical protein